MPWKISDADVNKFKAAGVKMYWWGVSGVTGKGVADIIRNGHTAVVGDSISANQFIVFEAQATTTGASDTGKWATVHVKYYGNSQPDINLSNLAKSSTDNPNHLFVMFGAIPSGDTTSMSEYTPVFTTTAGAPPLAWDGTPPSTAKVGDTLHLKWTGGEPYNPGYMVTIKNGSTVLYGDYVGNVHQYDYVLPSNSAGTLSVQVSDSHGHIDTTVTVTALPVVTPLAWVTHPAQADQNTDVAYTWSGGDASKGFVFQVLDSTGANILDDVDIPKGTFTHTVNRTAGDYIIRVYIEGEDHTAGADMLEQALKLIVPIPALVWGEHPASGKIGQDLKYTWTGGDTAKGYTVTVDKVAGGNVVNVDTMTPEYTLNHPTPEMLQVKVFNKGSTTGNLSQLVTITEPPADYVISGAEFKMLTDNYITMKANGVEVSAGFKLFYGDKLTAECPNTRQFYKSPSSVPETSISFEADNDFGFTVYLEFNIIDGQHAEVTFNPFANQSGKFLAFHAATKQYIDTKGSNHVYSITQDILDHVNNERFVRLDVTTTAEAVYDYGQFILGLIQLPFAIDPTYIGQPEPIRLATLDVSVSAPVVLTDKLRVDLGSIFTPKDTSTLLDYQNTTAIIHLPYAQPINLGLEYVIGETVTVEYIVDAYNGTAQINIGSSKLAGEVVATQNVDLGVQIPYTTLITTKAAENTSIRLGGDNHVRTPYIEIVRYDAVLADGFWTVPVPDEDVLNAQSGFVQVQEIELISKAIRVEKQEIISLLRAGVIFK